MITGGPAKASEERGAPQTLSVGSEEHGLRRCTLGLSFFSGARACW